MMKKTIIKLTDNETEKLAGDFLKKLGNKLAQNRKRASLSQDELAYCLSMDRSSISKYENGLTDISVSKLPLISMYCGFPLHDLFPKDEYEDILETFRTAVSITVERRNKQSELYDTPLDKIKPKKQLKAQIYEIDGQEYGQQILPKETSKSLKERYKSAEIHTGKETYTDKEFCEYIMLTQGYMLDNILNAGKLLNAVKEQPNKGTLKNALADYIVDEFVINSVAKKEPGEANIRAYEYYFRLYNRIKNPNWNPDWEMGDN